MIQRMTSRSKLILYILLNIVVSAATTLSVLLIWDASRKGSAPADQTSVLALITPASTAISGGPSAPALTSATEVAPPEAEPVPSETPLPADQMVIQVSSVVGAGDLESEVVLLKRVGPGNLRMTGWKLVGEDGTTYTFPAQPELILYQDGAVQVYSKTGENSATEVYWNRTDPAWKSGEVIKLLDANGVERTVYKVP